MRYKRDGYSVEAGQKKGRLIPPDHWYNNKPPEVPGVSWFYEAYRDLATCRLPDGSIPWTAAMAYADRKGLAPDVADTVWSVISRMDSAERQWRFDEMKAGGPGV